MEIGAPAISFLIDTWEAHLTPPEAASMADRASRGWDNHMIYPAAELALSVLPHAAALNPTEIQRAILQCKEQSDKMLERSCIIVENAAKSGGVYPEVLFQVARYWNELYLRNTPLGGENDHDVSLDVHFDHNVNFGQFDVNTMEQQQQNAMMMAAAAAAAAAVVQGGPPPGQPSQGGPGMVVQGPPQMMGGPGQGPGQVLVTPPNTGPPGAAQGPYHQAAVAQMNAAMGITPPYGYSFQCQNIYTHHHSVPFGAHGQMHHPMYMGPQPPPPQFAQYPGGPNASHAAAVAAAVAQQQQQQQQQPPPHQFGPPAFQQMAPMPGQSYPQMAGGVGGANVVGGVGGRMPQGPPMGPNQMQQYYGPGNGAAAAAQQSQAQQQQQQAAAMAALRGQQPGVYPFVSGAGQVVAAAQAAAAPPTAPARQRHPHHFSPAQLRYLMAAYNVGMLAMETLARRVHDDRPQAKYARDPPYGEDVKWLLRVSKKLGTQYLHQYCMCAVNSIVSPFVLHDVAIEAAHYLARNNPTLVLQHLRSALAPLVTKCQQM